MAQDLRVDVLFASVLSYALIILYEVLAIRIFQVPLLDEMALLPRVVDRLTGLATVLLNAVVFYEVSFALARLKRGRGRAFSSPKRNLALAGKMVLILTGMMIFLILIASAVIWSEEQGFFPYDKWLNPALQLMNLLRETAFWVCLGLVFLGLAQTAGGLTKRPDPEEDKAEKGNG